MELRYLVWGQFTAAPDGTFGNADGVLATNLDQAKASHLNDRIRSLAVAFAESLCSSPLHVLLPGPEWVYARLFPGARETGRSGRMLTRFQAVVLTDEELARLGYDPTHLDPALVITFGPDRLNLPAGYVHEVATTRIDPVPVVQEAQAPADSTGTTDLTNRLANGQILWLVATDPLAVTCLTVTLRHAISCPSYERPAVVFNLPSQAVSLISRISGRGALITLAAEMTAPRDWIPVNVEMTRRRVESAPRLKPVDVPFSPPISHISSDVMPATAAPPHNSVPPSPHVNSRPNRNATAFTYAGWALSAILLVACVYLSTMGAAAKDSWRREAWKLHHASSPFDTKFTLEKFRDEVTDVQKVVKEQRDEITRTNVNRGTLQAMLESEKSNTAGLRTKIDELQRNIEAYQKETNNLNLKLKAAQFTLTSAATALREVNIEVDDDKAELTFGSTLSWTAERKTYPEWHRLLKAVREAKNALDKK